MSSGSTHHVVENAGILFPSFYDRAPTILPLDSKLQIACNEIKLNFVSCVVYNLSIIWVCYVIIGATKQHIVDSDIISWSKVVLLGTQIYGLNC